MKHPRFIAPVLGAATVLLLATNAFPTVLRRHRLIDERNRLVQELQVEQECGAELREHLHAIQHDRFYLQRALAETWRGVPAGAIEWHPEKDWD